MHVACCTCVAPLAPSFPCEWEHHGDDQHDPPSNLLVTGRLRSISITQEALGLPAPVQGHWIIQSKITYQLRASTRWVIDVGPSPGPNKTVTLPASDLVVDPTPMNLQLPEWTHEQFSVTVVGDQLTVQRFDDPTAPWDQHLQLGAVNMRGRVCLETLRIGSDGNGYPSPALRLLASSNFPPASCDLELLAFEARTHETLLLTRIRLNVTDCYDRCGAHGRCHDTSGSLYDGESACTCDSGWYGHLCDQDRLTCNGDNQVAVGTQCVSCTQGAKPARGSATCQYAGECAAGCNCTFMPSDGLHRAGGAGAQLHVACDHLGGKSLPLATAVLDLRSAHSLEPTREVLPRTLAEWRRSFLVQNKPPGTVGYVDTPPQQLVLRLPQVRADLGAPKDVAVANSAQEAASVLARCGPLRASSFEDAVIRVSLCHSCQPCPQGHYAGMNGVCRPCDAGQFYQSHPGKVGLASECGCKACPSGTFTPESAATSASSCQRCPAGTVGDLPAGYRACWCLEGYSRVGRFGPCTSCSGTPGLLCRGDVRGLAPGFWWTFSDEADVHSYLAFARNLGLERGYNLPTSDGDSARRRDPLGVKQPVLEYNGMLPIPHKCPNKEACLGNLTADCATGYIGPLCAVCDSKYSMIFGSCRKCLSPAGTAAVIAAVVLVLGFVLFCVWKNNNDVVQDYAKVLENNPEVVAQAEPEAGETVARMASLRKPRDKVMGKIKIVVGFVQVIGSVASTFQSVTWPSSFVRVVDKFQVVTLDVFAGVSPSCLHPDSANFNFYDSLLVTILLTLLLPPAMAALSHFFLRAQRIADGAIRAGTIRNSCFILFLLYPNTALQICKALQSCHEICAFDGQENCKSFLPSDYSISCDTQVHRTWTVIAWVMLVPLLIVAFPVGLVITLFRRRSAIKLAQQTVFGDVSVSPANINILRTNPSVNGLSFFFEEYVSFVRIP